MNTVNLMDKAYSTHAEKDLYIWHCWSMPIQQGRAHLQYVPIHCSQYTSPAWKLHHYERISCVYWGKCNHMFSFSHAVLPFGNKAFQRANHVCHVLKGVPLSIGNVACLHMNYYLPTDTGHLTCIELRNYHLNLSAWSEFGMGNFSSASDKELYMFCNVFNRGCWTENRKQLASQLHF